MVSNLDIGDALTDALNNTTSLVTENDREGTFGILACTVGISKKLPCPKIPLEDYLRECMNPTIIVYQSRELGKRYAWTESDRRDNSRCGIDRNIRS